MRYNSIHEFETFTDGVGKLKMSGDNTDDDTSIEEPDVAEKHVFDTTMIVVGGRNILQVQAGNPTKKRLFKSELLQQDGTYQQHDGGEDHQAGQGVQELWE